jgi:anti-sigma-K factor RskA
MSTSIAVVVALLAGRCLLTASEKQPLTASVKADYQTVRNFVVRAAETMPADDYALVPPSNERH